MDLRVIPPRKKTPNKYDFDTTFIIPAKLVQIQRANQVGSVVPIIIERLDFKTGSLINTPAITFQKSLDIFDDLKKVIPFYTDCIIYKENGKIMFKVIGVYNAGFAELFYSVADDILDNDERQILKVFKANYRELEEWSIQS